MQPIENKENKIIGRAKEINALEAVFSSKTAEFIAVYGRRRIGKTYLIKTFFQNTTALFFHITGTKDAPMHEQIDDFCSVIESVFYQNTLSVNRPPSWKKTFELLTNIIKREASHQTVILFFDELPWLAGPRSRFISALDYYWNRHWSDMHNIKLIVCGSAASWMIDHIVSHRGGLHNRISGQIALSPFDLQETNQFLLSRKMHYTDTQVLEVFMALGGVPYYLKFLQKNFSIAQNIDQYCFQNKGILTDEFPRLFSSLFNQPKHYEDLIRIIANRRNGVARSDIIKKSKVASDGGRLQDRLNALEKSGFIVSFIPYGFTKRKTFYRVIDEYALFYLYWIEPALSNIRKLDKTIGYWLEHVQSPAWHAWAGYAFESVCYKHIAQIRTALKVPVSADVGSWQFIPKKKSIEQGAQIDLLFDRTDGVITVCEIKYTNQPYQLTKEEYYALMQKIEIFKKRTKSPKQIQCVLITALPIKPTLYSEECVVQNVVLQDLMK